MERHIYGERERDRPNLYEAENRSQKQDHSRNQRKSVDNEDWKQKLDGPLSRLLGVDEEERWR